MTGAASSGGAIAAGGAFAIGGAGSASDATGSGGANIEVTGGAASAASASGGNLADGRANDEPSIAPGERQSDAPDAEVPKRPPTPKADSGIEISLHGCETSGCLDGSPSCANDVGCGASGTESCCRSLFVPGGTFLRINDSRYPATVDDFYLDEHEVNVARFQAFLDAYPSILPKDGEGAHPKIPGSGWVAKEMDDALIAGLGTKFNIGPLAVERPPEQWGAGDSLAAGPGFEKLPINRTPWELAFAFCIWDGGRLPTEAEWNYAAAGGDEQRTYPWGEARPNPLLGAMQCAEEGTCSLPEPVGTHPAGNGRWGHADLAGNVQEWVLDNFWRTLPRPCDNCTMLVPEVVPLLASPAPISTRTIELGRSHRGGGVNCAGGDPLNCSTELRSRAAEYETGTGFRCARDAQAP